MIFEIFSIYTLVEAIFLVLPAYAANGLAPVFGGTHPIDSGRSWRGKPLFGPGKTWEGLAFGSITGMIVGAIEMFAAPYLPWGLSPAPLDIAPMTPVLGLVLGFGAMLGDLAGSFIKRRLGLRRGQAAPILDQDNFIVGSLALASLLIPVRWEWAILLLIITPLIHWLACIIGYALRIKQTPW